MDYVKIGARHDIPVVNLCPPLRVKSIRTPGALSDLEVIIPRAPKQSSASSISALPIKSSQWVTTVSARW
jgi:hypothetical protein